MDNQLYGIRILISNGVRIERNAVHSRGYSGIQIDRFGERNAVLRNVVLGHRFDLVEDSERNCWLANRFQTSRGTIACPSRAQARADPLGASS